MPNDPNAIIMPPPEKPEGPAFAEITVAYPGNVTLTIGAYKNGVRWAMTEPGPDDDAPPAVHQLMLPWQAWYKVRRYVVRQLNK